ncbi:MAG: sugar ABC transporter ATP-binding protein [Acidobacteria bacterium]|nr:sugar ABC transporter ATP-binding protein [Acidobacteriota bacterium]
MLVASALRKSFAGVRALTDLSFTLEAGEVHALVGENGAGKSTFVRILTGAETPDSGSLAIGGQAVSGLTPAIAKALGIAAIHQHPALFPHLTVAENVALVLESGRPWTRVDWRARTTRAGELLGRIGAAIDPGRCVETLSLPEQQLVEIAKAVGADARIVLMDEPTASLTGREVDTLFDVVDRLRRAGTGVIYISHRLEEIPRVAGRVTVIRDGRTMAAGLPPDTDSRQLVRLMAGRGDEDARIVVPVRARPEPAAPVLELRHVSSRAAGVRDVTFGVSRGEIVGLAGLVGAGRTELAEALFGLRPVDDGEVVIEGRPMRFASPTEAIDAGVAYLPEDRRRHGVLAEMSVTANTSLASLGRISRGGLVDRAAESRLAQSFVGRFAIKTPSIAALAGTLSGGNQQKVALARWLATGPSLLILDEPTQGVDVAAKAEIHQLIRELSADGLAVLLISSELAELLVLSDRVVVMRRGRVAGIVAGGTATEESIAALAIAPGDTLGGRPSA